ncbi:PREDICTED: uncharacterized protein LOC107070570 isoform X1 [Polistes dominula]|uniref:Uncharacterized protein LOC107070570 isoform X1 n=1 Tax=Polistes dominula TaxID=743375 RepID=A0ABM1IVY7_POLDO|nr:PREDICTED: uncharacterized protein LOC107070570 isoform X1 [Polistes dominula]
MTRFHNSDVNLKSSVYNLAGENYFEQLSSYNSMRFHIRRVLLAKSVVDARNKKYINNKKKELKTQLPRKFSLDNFIDQLAFDTKHHPMDMLRMNLDKYSSRHSEDNCETYPYNINDIDYSQLAIQTADTESNSKNNYQNRSMLKSKKIVSDRSESRPKTAGNKHIKELNSKKRIIHRKCRCNEKPIYVTCGKSFESPTNPYHSDSGSSSSSIIQEDHTSSSLSSPVQMQKLKYAEIEAKEDARYVKFAYEITKDIIKCGIYTDKELNEIFKKHLQRHRTTLDLNKMLKEIYRLKTFLNVSEESDASDDDTEFSNMGQIQLQEVRPPTPPKILDENKVIGKLLSYQKLMETQCNKEPRSKKSVVLIDANPELLITERDVITSLLEVGIDPKQAENICKSLHHKSMESVLDNMVELKINSIPNKLETLPDKLNNVELQKENTFGPENTFLEDLKSGTKNHILENENKSSTTDDLSSKQDETIQTPQSPVTLHNDNYTEPKQSS